MTKRIRRGIEAAIETVVIFLAALAAKEGIYYFAAQNGEVVESLPILVVALPMMIFVLIGICYTSFGVVEVLILALSTLVMSVLIMPTVMGGIITPVTEIFNINLPIWSVLVVYIVLCISIVLFTARWWSSLGYVITGE